MDDLSIKKFILLSVKLGNRVDLIQGKGGNTSIKLDDEHMLIKASGFCLNQITPTEGLSHVNYQKVKDSLLAISAKTSLAKVEKEKLVNQSMKEFLIDKNSPRPSIEIFLHAYFYKYTFHLHPIALLSFLCQKDWKDWVEKFYPKCLAIDYFTPGIELGIELYHQLNIYLEENGSAPEVIFLKNHGVIISSDDLDEIEEITNLIMSKAEKNVGNNYNEFKIEALMADFFQQFSNGKMKSFLCQNMMIKKIYQERPQIFFLGPICPDDFVFCGAYPVRMKSLSDHEIEDYRHDFYNLPKIVVYEELVFILAQDVKKAKEIEICFLAHLMALDQATSIGQDKTEKNILENIEFLSKEEISYLANWEAEKFRAEI